MIKFIQLAVIIWCMNSVIICLGANPRNEIPVNQQLHRFYQSKKDQAKKMSSQLKIEIAPEIWKFFEMLDEDNFQTITNRFEQLKSRNSQYDRSNVNDETVGNPVWQIVLECYLAYEQFHAGEPRYAQLFAAEVRRSIPKGSIYFGGTDPGRGLITALSESHQDGKPFYTITQNAFANGYYMTYLQQMYGDKISIPQQEDSKKAFEEYIQDVQKRLQQNQLKPGEDIKIVENRIQVSGQVSVMQINGLLAKMFFDRNPEREFFIEESFPLDWMRPHLVPHGFIFKLNREPLTILPSQIIRSNNRYWRKQITPMIGDWIRNDTPVSQVCEFAEKVYVKKNYDGFKGDTRYVQNEFANKMFSKLRSNFAHLYHWRAKETIVPKEKQQLIKETNDAYLQSIALCPQNSEGLFGFIAFLIEQNQIKEALLVANLGEKADPANSTIVQLKKSIIEKIGSMGGVK